MTLSSHSCNIFWRNWLGTFRSCHFLSGPGTTFSPQISNSHEFLPLTFQHMVHKSHFLLNFPIACRENNFFLYTMILPCTSSSIGFTISRWRYILTRLSSLVDHELLWKDPSLPSKVQYLLNTRMNTSSTGTQFKVWKFSWFIDIITCSHNLKEPTFHLKQLFFYTFNYSFDWLLNYENFLTLYVCKQMHFTCVCVNHSPTTPPQHTHTQPAMVLIWFVPWGLMW